MGRERERERLTHFIDNEKHVLMSRSALQFVLYRYTRKRNPEVWTATAWITMLFDSPR